MTDERRRAIEDRFAESLGGRKKGGSYDFTTLACQSCRRPVATTRHLTAAFMVFQCPACGHMWEWSELSTRVH